MLASYEADFAASWGRKARDVLEEVGAEVFGVKVRADSSAASRWDLSNHVGGMQTAGCGGPITGKGAHLLVLDDVIKNAEESMSQGQRDKTWDWFVSTALTRLEPGGSVLLIMTRWHPDDLAGRLLKRQEEVGEPWDVISFPALALDNDPLGRRPGEALWPERYPAEALAEIKATQGSLWFTAMYQQSPILPEGNLFRRGWFRQFVADGDQFLLDGGRVFARRACYRFLAVDPAASEKQTADYTAIGVFAVTPENDLLILDMVRERLGVEGIVPRLRRLAAQYAPDFVVMEANGFQVALAKEAKRTPGLPAIREVTPEGKGKLVRATPAIIRAESGQIFLPSKAPWAECFLEELTTFTGMDDKHDDQVDVLSYAARQISKSANIYPTAVGGVEVRGALAAVPPDTPHAVTPPYLAPTTGPVPRPISGPGALDGLRGDRPQWWIRLRRGPSASAAARRGLNGLGRSPGGYR
jgi:predicted phage terminase large subunit-like protein